MGSLFAGPGSGSGSSGAGPFDMPPFDERLVDEYIKGTSIAELSRRHSMPPDQIRAHIERLLSDQRLTAKSAAVSTESARYDALIRTYMPRALLGDTESAALVLSISAQRRKLLGLDAPTAITADVTLTATDIDAVVHRILGDSLPSTPALTLEAEEAFPLPDVSPAITGRTVAAPIVDDTGNDQG